MQLLHSVLSVLPSVIVTRCSGVAAVVSQNNDSVHAVMIGKRGSSHEHLAITLSEEVVELGRRQARSEACT